MFNEHTLFIHCLQKKYGKKHSDQNHFKLKMYAHSINLQMTNINTAIASYSVSVLRKPFTNDYFTTNDMEPKMKILKTVQKCLASYGYCANQDRFNKMQLQLVLEGILFNALLLAYFFFVANTPEKYMRSIFMIVAGIFLLISKLSTIYEMPTIFIAIDRFEETINESESKMQFYSNEKKPFIVFYSIST